MADVAAPYALLDDRDSSAARPTSRLYTGFVREHRCVDPATLDAMWAEVDADQRAGLHAVLMADYEWGAKLLGAGHERLGRDDPSSLRVLMFETLERLDRATVDERLAALEGPQAVAPGAAGTLALQPSLDRAEFTQAIARIHEAIRAGETYQVNYTYRLHGRAFGSPVALYRRLRARQPVTFGALIALPLPAGGPPRPDTVTHVLSCSPELFIRHEAGLLTARPMKGTASRQGVPEGDSETARHLSIDIKNRAENLMIVDLLRNDLSRLARTGTVRVPALFAIEPYTTVFQMTSTIEAQLRPDVGMPELLRAVYPCGSITGAPKHHTMQLISSLESTLRGLYCGAIGWVDAPQGEHRCGDLCLSVAIRTLTLGPAVQGLRAARLGIGAGIVLDSAAEDEYRECTLKARFLTGLDPGFELFETMHARRDEGIRHLDRHLARLRRSAHELGFVLDEPAIRAQLQGALPGLPSGVPHRLRLALSHEGRTTITTAALGPLPLDAQGRVRLLIAPAPLAPVNPLAVYKTTLRQDYDDGVRAAEAAGAFDSLFLHADGRLAEGGRSSVFLRLDGRWVTPPLADGALPGIWRGVLLDDAHFGATERRLTSADLHRAEEVLVCNALRGALPAVLVPADAPATAPSPTAR